MIMALFALALLGGLVGFLFFNFNPAKVFMGDCGSLFVGFTLASLTLRERVGQMVMVWVLGDLLGSIPLMEQSDRSDVRRVNGVGELK